MLRANAPATIRRKTAAVACSAVRALRNLVCEKLPRPGFGVGCVQGGQEPHQEPDARRHGQRRCEQAPAGLEVQVQAEGHRQVRYQQRHVPHGDRCRGNAQAPRDQTETEALDGNLSDQSRAACSQGLPDRHLAAADRRVGEQEARDVGADDEQERADQSAQHGQGTERGERQARVVRLPDRQGPRLSGEARPLLGVCLMESSADHRQPGACLVATDAVVQSTDYGVSALAALLLSGVTEPYRLLEGRGQPDVDAEDALQGSQLDRRHPHDRERRPVDDDRAPQHRRIAPELGPPCCVADDCDGAVLGRHEPAPEDRPQSHRGEVAGLHYPGGQDPGLAADTRADRNQGCRGKLLEHVARGLANVEEVRPGVCARPPARKVARGHRDEPMRVGAGQGPQQQGVDEREDDGVRTDADGQDGGRHRRKHRARAQPAQPELEVPPQVVDGTEAVHVAALLLDRLQASESGQRGAARFPGSHPAPDVVVDFHLQVRLKLCVQLAFERTAAEQIQQSNGEGPQEAHHQASPTSRSASSMATETRFQLRASSSACRRPAGVNW